MGGFAQALTSGLGETAEAMGKGQVEAQQQNHAFTMDFLANQARNRQLDIEQQGQTNAYELGKSSQALQRQMIEDAGFKDSGVSRLDDGSWVRNVYNPRTNQTSQFKLSGAPVESPEYMNALYKNLKQEHPNWSEEMLASIAYKAPYAARNGDPASDYLNLYNLAVNNSKLLNPNESPRDFANRITKQYHDAGAIAALKSMEDKSGLTTQEKSLIEEATKGPFNDLEQQKNTELRALGKRGVADYAIEHAIGYSPYLASMKAINDKYTPLEDAYHSRLSKLMEDIMDRKQSGRSDYTDLISNFNNQGNVNPHSGEQNTDFGPSAKPNGTTGTYKGHPVIVKGGRWVGNG